MPYIAQQVSGRIPGIGSVEIISVPVSAGTSIPVLFSQVHAKAPAIFVSASYAAGAFVTAATSTGCTLNFTAPTGAQSFQVMVVG